MKCNFKTEREVVNGQKTDKVNVFIELLSCDTIEETMLTTVMHFYTVYYEKYPLYHTYPERVKFFDNEFGNAAIESTRKFYESPEENGETIETNKSIIHTTI
jgi:hypothetical protein